jgi:hypothetical protein
MNFINSIINLQKKKKKKRQDIHKNKTKNFALL